MPRIPQSITNSIVYLYQSLDDSETGVDAGGSGFLLEMQSERSKTSGHIYVVTNAHVIEGGATCVRVNLKYPSSGNTRIETFSFSISDWVIHEKHDLAVCPLPRELKESLYNITVIGANLLVTEEEFLKKDIGEGDELVYIGRFVGHAGKYQNLPSVRFGNISMVPNEDEPIEYEINGKQKKQVGFLVEARSRSGYSGSPVFFLHQHTTNSSRFVLPGLDMRLLGVDWGHIPERVLLKDPNDFLSGGRWFVEVHSGMMCVVPSWYLDDFIKTAPRLIDQRARDDEFYGNQKPNGRPD